MMLRLSTLLRLVVVASLLASLLLIHPSRAYACSCAMPGSALVELRNSSAVFAGKVTAIETTGSFMSPVGQRQMTFKVSEVWKGPTLDTMIVETGMGGGDCGYDFVMDEEYLVYAYGSGPYYTSICSRNAVLTAATQDLADLGEGDIPEPSPQVSGFNVLPIIIAICSVVMLLGFAAAFFLYRWLSRPRRA